MSLCHVLTFREPGRGSITHWTQRWRNELSPDQRCWTPNKVHQQQKRLALSTRGRAGQGHSACPCPPRPCPALKLRTLPREMDAPENIPARRCTLDDLRMPHSREDALAMLRQRRDEMDARHRDLRSDGGEICRVSSYSRRRFESAVSGRGKGPAPPATPEEAGLFFQPARPSWVSNPPTPSTDAARAAGRMKPRPHSFAATNPPVVSSAQTMNPSSRPRPDSEPPGGTFNGGGRFYPGLRDREFNHLRCGRELYPHIQQLVQRYNSDLKVVCPDTPTGEVVEPQQQPQHHSRRHSKDFSVASGFFLVPVKPASDVNVEEEKKEENPQQHVKEVEEEEKVEKDAIPVEDPVSQGEANVLTLQQGEKTEDQLPLQITAKKSRNQSLVMRPSRLSHTATAARPSKGINPGGVLLEEDNKNDGGDDKADKDEDDDDDDDDDEEPTPPWRCWVDDATVSTVHSHSGSDVGLEEDLVDAPGVDGAHLRLSRTTGQDGAGSGPGGETSKQSTRQSRVGTPSAAAAADPAAAGPAKNPSPVPPPAAPAAAGGTTNKDKKGKNRKSGKELAAALPEPPTLPPPPPPPVEEPAILVEEVEAEPEPEPEPEPVPPSYICPSSESKSHSVEIRRWLRQSPFRTATRTMPIF